ncbi:MAG: hypothetical protein M3169_07835 [Candidatus Eremiobacteraeota bacterium]|nr:hypothetical protein [Candidatus Eremiobacteraeota bacterium]
MHDIVKRVVAAGAGGQRFYTYVPTRPGPFAGKAQAAIVYVPHGGSPVAGAKRQFDAKKVEASAKSAVASLKGTVIAARHDVSLVKRHGTTQGPAPYLLAIGVQIKPGQESAFHDAAKKLADANETSPHPVEYSVFKGKSKDKYLIVLRGHDVSGLAPDGHHTAAHLRALKATLAGHFKFGLRLVPTASQF